jgi:hypothetical protein
VTYLSAPGFTGTDTFTYRASDGVDASPPALVTLTVDPPDGSEHVFACLADTMAKSTSPGTNYGTETTLRIRGGEPEWRSFVEFQVSGLADPVERATLRLHVTGSSNDGGTLHATASTWSETGLTWSNAPAPLAALAVAGPVSAGTWLELDVTSAVQADGTYAFVLVSHSTTSAYFSSREGAEPPELVVTLRAGGAPPPHRRAPPPRPAGTSPVAPAQ